MPALGYRVQIGETIVSFSGDSRMCQGLVDLVANADLAVIEATYDQHPDPKKKVHLSELEARELGKTAQEYLLVHRKPDAAKNIYTKSS